MAHYLLIDLGASRIKSAMADLATGVISRIMSQDSVPAAHGLPGRFEVPAEALRRKFVSVCSHYFKGGGARPAGIVLCSEMHGFAVLDSHNVPRSGYISWKDSRGLQPVKGARTIDLIERGLGRRFRAITGMQLRAGLPYLNALHMARTGGLKSGDKIVSLPEFLVALSGKGPLAAHETMTAGLGFYDIYARKLSPVLLDFFFSETGVRPEPGQAAQNGTCGYLRLAGRDIPVFAGLGDHQCAVLGAGNGPGTLSVNIGTGSQVSVLTKRRDAEKDQQRPFFDGYKLSTITHIPAGRALNEYVSFLAVAAAAFGAPRADAWKVLSGLRLKDIEKSTLTFDLGIFPGAWGYKAGGKISGISEGSLTPENYLASLLKALGKQYVEAVERLAPLKRGRIVLSGGVAHKLPVLADLIGRGGAVPAGLSAEKEETFAGLRAAAAVFSGRDAGFIAAAGRYKKNVRRN